MRRLLPLLLLTGCTTTDIAQPTEQPGPSEGQRELSELAGKSARRGSLRVTPTLLQLRIHSGNDTVPFLDLERRTHNLGCWQKAGIEDEHGEIVESDWWLFSNDTDAVALQFTASTVDAWFWDEARSCLVRDAAMPRVTLEDATPKKYYKAMDAQVAYRFHTGSMDGHEVTLTDEGDELIDIIEAVEGDERLVVARNEISLESADGRALLHDAIDIDPDWPCFNAQLTVFEGSGTVYAITAFDTYGALNNCDSADSDNRYVSSIFDWNPATARFELAYRVFDRLRPLAPTGEDSLIRVLRAYPVAGGQLIANWERTTRHQQGARNVCVETDAGTGVCLSHQDCWSWGTSLQRKSRYALLTPAGVRIDVGLARLISKESGDDCDGAKGP